MLPEHSEIPIRKRAWDVRLIVSLSHSLAKMYPIEWVDWQHWARDIMEKRDRDLAKGIHHRLVSLITACRLLPFVWHVGMRKIFVIVARNPRR
jgi:hypothetical protein